MVVLAGTGQERLLVEAADVVVEVMIPFRCDVCHKLWEG